MDNTRGSPTRDGPGRTRKFRQGERNPGAVNAIISMFRNINRPNRPNRRKYGRSPTSSRDGSSSPIRSSKRIKRASTLGGKKPKSQRKRKPKSQRKRKPQY